MLKVSPSFLRRLDCRELLNIEIEVPVPAASRPTTCASSCDLDMSEMVSVVSGAGRKPTCGVASIPTAIPDTASAIYGWLREPAKVGGPTWRRPKVTREIVRYSEVYYEQNGRNPYQKKRI